jgi:transcriptional regulator with XRE-family HTH domain
LPSYHPIVKRAQKPKLSRYPKELSCIGDHIRQKRLDLKLEQKEVAQIIQVSESTIWNWETNRMEPLARYYPAIMAFLGYCPWEPLQRWEQILERYRIHQGLTLEQFAREMGVDPGTLARQLKNGASAYLKKKVAGLMDGLDSLD